MLNIYKNFCKEEYEGDKLVSFAPMYDEYFNFAYDVVDEIASREPNKRALFWCNDKGEEKVFTFGDMSRYSNITANMLLDKGIKYGDRVLVILKRSYKFWFVLLALHKIGAIAVPATSMLKERDILYRCNLAEINAIICTTDGDVIERVENVIQDCSTVRTKISVNEKRDGWIDFDGELKNYSNQIDRIYTTINTPMLIYFTSGTTGLPKMVCHDYTYAISHIFTAKHWQNVRPGGLHLTISDTGWMKSMWGKMYGQWFMETGIFVYDFDEFVPSDILGLFRKYQITTFCAPPTMYRFFIKENLEDYDLSSLEYATVAGEALNPEVYNKFYDATGIKIMEGFGQSETTLVMYNPIGSAPRLGSMGIPSPLYSVDLVDENDNFVSNGSVGEIVIKTDKQRPCGMFCGYYKSYEQTKAVWHGGLYHTGDTAWRDEDGYYWYVGRTDDIIKSSGYRIGPFEIESVLMEHPAVLECAITGAPDPVRGQVVKATIVLAKGYVGSDELKKQIQNYVKGQTAPYKYPRVIEFTDSLPKTISGKIKRKELKI